MGKDGELEEIHPACGGNWGGAMVDEAFMEFLTNLAGTEALKEFCSAEIYDFHDLMRDFESKKKSSGRQSDSAKVCIRIPCSLQNDINRRKADAMQGDEVRIERDKLILSLGKMHDFFNCSKEAVRKYLKGLFSLKSLQGVNNILMVGGYSESAILQQFIKESFKDKSVITPASPGLAVLKGAVLYGHDPSVIAERRCRFTYGTVCNKIFNESKHKESVKFTDDSGKIRAGDCFGIHVAVGRAVKIGTFQPEQSYTPGRKYQDMMHFPLYVCPRESPVYVTEDDCVEIGNLSIDISDLTGTEKDKKVRMALCLSGTEITIKAKKKQTGDILTATIKYDH